jgi:hypothetical protein
MSDYTVVHSSQFNFFSGFHYSVEILCVLKGFDRALSKDSRTIFIRDILLYKSMKVFVDSPTLVGNFCVQIYAC